MECNIVIIILAYNYYEFGHSLLEQRNIAKEYIWAIVKDYLLKTIFYDVFAK